MHSSTLAAHTIQQDTIVLQYSNWHTSNCYIHSSTLAGHTIQQDTIDPSTLTGTLYSTVIVTYILVPKLKNLTGC